MSSYNQPPEVHTRLEALQRQVSYLVVCGIIGSFFIFMAGYYSGKKYVIEESYGSFSTDSFVDVVYGAFRTVQEAFTPYNEQSLIMGLSKDEALVSGHSTVKKSSEERPYYAEMARFGTHKEAEIFRVGLLEAGFDARIKVCLSEMQSGGFCEWYQV
ncbi:hypothetical protein H0W26_01850, partial [Candidatus Dependentiae bacterium]|nr:hypothetical protein [Candidatus Dependentiae bacterium]